MVARREVTCANTAVCVSTCCSFVYQTWFESHVLLAFRWCGGCGSKQNRPYNEHVRGPEHTRLHFKSDGANLRATSGPGVWAHGDLNPQSQFRLERLMHPCGKLLDEWLTPSGVVASQMLLSRHISCIPLSVITYDLPLSCAAFTIYVYVLLNAPAAQHNDTCNPASCGLFVIHACVTWRYQRQ